jgi:hypothetical protein
MLHALTARFVAVLVAASSVAVAQWVQRAPATPPSARASAAMEFVPANGGLMLFGGSAPLLNNQTWVYDGTSWTQLSPTASPSGRFGAQLVYDSIRNVAVLYGGLASNISIPPPTSETWEWDGATWTQAAPAANAGPRYRYGSCFDSGRGRVVMYGGESTQLLGTPNNQTWEYDGTTWTQITTTGNPGPRERPAMCYHAGVGATVMFGGYDGVALTDQTWIYIGTTSTWLQLVIPGPKPSPRNASALVYDSLHNQCVLMGGQDVANVLSDTWVFDGSRWVQQATTTQPARDHVMAFLPTTGQVVRFGGFTAAPSTLSNQTWELGTGSYGVGCVGTNGVPALTSAGAMTLGQPWTVNATNLNPTFSLAFFVIGFTRLPGIDLTALLNMPGCAAYTTPDLLLGISGAGGTASWTWPAVSGPIGAALYTQALCFDPPANGFGFTISNAVYATIGY